MDDWIELDVVRPVWEGSSQVNPPVVVGTREGGFLQTPDRGDTDRIHDHLLLAYLNPGRFAMISRSRVCPFWAEFDR